MNKKWKIFGWLILALFGLLVVLDVTVWAIDQRQWEQRNTDYRVAEEAGYPEDYSICSRQGSVTIGETEYLSFHAHRSMILDGDYHENLLALPEDSFEDAAEGQTENLEILAKEVGRITDEDGTDYTLIDIYKITECREQTVETWFWRAAAITIVSVPVLLAAALIWIIHWIWSKRKGKINHGNRNINQRI